MFNERGKRVKKAGPASPVQILGFSGQPQAGDKFQCMDSEKDARTISTKRQQLKREHEFRKTRAKTLFEFSEQIKQGEVKELTVIIKGDMDGSVEALEDSLLKIKNDEVEVNIIHKSVGAITEADVLLAAASNAFILGFHVRPNLNARNLAAKEEVDIRTYDVIYDAIGDVKAALEGMLSPEVSEEVLGNVEVREIFKVPKVGTIAGCYVTSGKVIRNSKVKIVRDGVVIYNGVISSLKRFKDDIKEVQTGYECGIGVENYNDLKIEDVLEVYQLVESKRELK
jgi:translation initiation factor IF-2